MPKMAATRPPAGAYELAPESVWLAAAAELESEPDAVESAVEEAVDSSVADAMASLREAMALERPEETEAVAEIVAEDEEEPYLVRMSVSDSS